jgi:2-methylcitrate dehydratase PrpD
LTAPNIAVIDAVVDLACQCSTDIPASARAMATLSLFDWCVVALAGTGQPVSRIIRDMVLDEGGRPAASVIGAARKGPPRAAALANGTISHALDYDDTHFAHVGHPSVAILPAALALAEDRDASAAALLDAFLLGAENSIRIGMALGREHYEFGFHQTATAGAFGATVAAGRVIGLAPAQMRAALSIASTRASGLKSQFGTMGKPYNAGIAAANGVEAALLAERGFISCDDGLGAAQGFLATHAATGADLPAADGFLFEDIKHKFHACCHGTHAMIEALQNLTTQRAIAPDAVTSISVRVNPRWLKVCDIKAPRSGLEIKFSYAYLAAMVLSGIDTAADRAYADALCDSAALRQLSQRVTVVGDAQIGDTETEVALTLPDGLRVTGRHDLSVRHAPEVIANGLRRKARALLGDERAEAIWAGIARIDARSARDLAALLRG